MLTEHFADRKVCIIGLGYVGLTLAVAMADVGFQIHGVEVNPVIIEALANNRAHFLEVGLNERLAKQLKRGLLTYGTKVPADPEITVFIVTVGTPITKEKQTDYGPLRTVLSSIAEVLKDGDAVILRSTVRVGVTRNLAKKILDDTGKRYSLAFCPERTLEGKALAELRTLPQVIGGIDSDSTFRASQIFSFLTPSVVRVSNAETAEMIKLINNTQRDMMFAFANEVAEMCDMLRISATEVISGGNLGYSRASLPYPGPVGGPCLEKDPYILAEGLEAIGFRPGLALAGRVWNEGLLARSVSRMAEDLADRGATKVRRIAILGAAFKGRPETSDLRGSPVIQLIAELRKTFNEADLVSWDPIVGAEELAGLGLQPTNSPEEAFAHADIVVMQNNHHALAQLDLPELSRLMNAPGLIYDFWHQHRLMSDEELSEGVRYAALGTFYTAPSAL